MHERSEFAELLWVAKDDGAQPAAIDFASGPQYLRSKVLDNFAVNGAAAPEQFVAYTISVNDLGAQRLHEACHRALAGCDPSRQSKAAVHKNSDE
jgi:phosphoribosylaminoimidazole carboxylase (NCAIR synthetase)